MILPPVPMLSHMDDGEGSIRFVDSISQTEGDKTWSAPPPRSWHLRPSPLEPLASSSIIGDATSTSLSRYCLESIAQQIERYEPASFSTVPDQTLDSIWDYLKRRYREAPQRDEARSQRRKSTRSSGELYLWLLKAQTQAMRTSQGFGNGVADQVEVRRVTQLVHMSELLAYLPTTSPLKLMQIPPTPDFTLLTTLDLSSSSVTDSMLLPLRHLTRLFFLFVNSCPRVSDAGIKSLAMSLDYKDIVLASTREKGDYELPDGRGCWRLRGIWLDGCPGITDRAVTDLARWPFLNIISLGNTKSTTASFANASGWGRAMAADATFLISRIASPYGFRTSNPCVERKVKAYQSRWPETMACVKGEKKTIGVVEVIATGAMEAMPLRHQESTAWPRKSTEDSEVPKDKVADVSAWDTNDRSTAFATDHGLASWLKSANAKADPSRPGISRRRAVNQDVDSNLDRDSQYSQADLAKLYIRPAPTLCSVRKALLRLKGNLNPRSMVELEGKLPPSALKSPTTVRPKTHRSPTTSEAASATSSSLFSLNAPSGDITILRERRQGEHTVLVPVPYRVPRGRLTTRRLDDEQAWGAPAESTNSMSGIVGRLSPHQGNKRSASSQLESRSPLSGSHAEAGGSMSGQSLPQPRLKGLSMFKKLKR